MPLASFHVMQINTSGKPPHLIPTMALVYSFNRDMLQNDLYDCEEKFLRARDQVILLSQRMKDVNHRYENAKTNGQRAFVLHLRLRKVILEGMMGVYMEYLDRKAKDMVRLRFSLVEIEEAQRNAEERLEETEMEL